MSAYGNTCESARAACAHNLIMSGEEPQTRIIKDVTVKPPDKLEMGLRDTSLPHEMVHVVELSSGGSGMKIDSSHLFSGLHDLETLLKEALPDMEHLPKDEESFSNFIKSIIGKLPEGNLFRSDKVRIISDSSQLPTEVQEYLRSAGDNNPDSTGRRALIQVDMEISLGPAGNSKEDNNEN